MISSFKEEFRSSVISKCIGVIVDVDFPTWVEGKIPVKRCFDQQSSRPRNLWRSLKLNEVCFLIRETALENGSQKFISQHFLRFCMYSEWSSHSDIDDSSFWSKLSNSGSLIYARKNYIDSHHFLFQNSVVADIFVCKWERETVQPILWGQFLFEHERSRVVTHSFFFSNFYRPDRTPLKICVVFNNGTTHYRYQPNTVAVVALVITETFELETKIIDETSKSAVNERVQRRYACSFGWFFSNMRLVLHFELCGRKDLMPKLLFWFFRAR